MIMYLLFFLSKERDFAVQLGLPIEKTIYANLSGDTVTNYADFLVCVLSKVILDDKHSLYHSLYDYSLYILSNVSAFVTHLNKNSAFKLIKLFAFFSRPAWILSGEYKYKPCFIVLEVINNILQYQYSGNHFVVYSLIANGDIFYRLLRLKLKEEKKVEFVDNETKELVEFKEIDVSESDTQKDTLWTPTNEWMLEWQQMAPIQVILQFLENTLPRIKNMIKRNANDENVIYQFLQQNTLVGLLPLPHQIIVRPFIPQVRIFHDIQDYLWKVIYLRTLRHFLIELDVNLFPKDVSVNK